MKSLTKKLLVTGIVAVMGVATLVPIASAQQAMNGEGLKLGQKDPEVMQQRMETMEQMREAVENGDYATWYDLVTQDGRTPKILEYVNEGNFHLLNELHQAKEERNIERAKEIIEELGIPPRPVRKHMRKKHRRQIFSEMKELIQNNDYQGWYELMTKDGRNPKILEFINEDNFYLLNELHQARQDGDFDKAEEIRNELGLPEKPEMPPGQFRKNIK